MSQGTGFNERTLLTDIKNLRLYFSDCLVIETARADYRFQLIDPQKYAKEKRTLIASEPLFVIVESILVNKLLSFEEWADRLFLSESSMRRHLLHLSKVLKSYQLEISLNPVDLIGEEVNIRKFFKDFYYEADEISPFSLEPFVEIDELLRVIEENLHHAASGTDTLPTDFYYKFYIMIQRSGKKNYLNLSKLENMDWRSDVNYQYFLSLKPKIRNYYGFEILDQELLGLYLFSICKRTIDSPLKEQVFVQQFNLWLNLKVLTETFLQDYAPFLLGPQYPAAILIESFFTSVNYLHLIGPIMNKNIREVNEYAQVLYQEKYHRTLSILNEHWELLGIDSPYQEDIAVSLVLIVEAIRDTYVSNKKIYFRVVRFLLYLSKCESKNYTLFQWLS